jgi:hypothetical protein
VTLAFDAADLRHVSVTLDQSLVVLQFRALTSTLDAAAVRCVGAPQTNVAIV